MMVALREIGFLYICRRLTIQKIFINLRFVFAAMNVFNIQNKQSRKICIYVHIRYKKWYFFNSSSIHLIIFVFSFYLVLFVIHCMHKL